MERDYETNSSHYVPYRTSLWCPICGASEGKGCTEVKGLRFAGHNASVLGSFRAASPTQNVDTPAYSDFLPARKDAPRPKGWKPTGWMN